MTLDVVAAGESVPATGATFYYDLAVPDCYLTAERLRGELPVTCDWLPVSAAALGPAATPAAVDEAALAAAVGAQGLLPLRLPASWPPDSDLAMRVATYAKGAGKSIAFSLAAFRQAFAGGRDLADEATVLLAAAACELHPTAVLKGASLGSTERALQAAAGRARAAGIDVLPAIEIGPAVHCGPDALTRAVAGLADRR